MSRVVGFGSVGIGWGVAPKARLSEKKLSGCRMDLKKCSELLCEFMCKVLTNAMRSIML